MTKKIIDELTYEVIGAAIEVHKALGPGLLENIYHRCMKEELRSRNKLFYSEQKVMVLYKGKKLETDLRCDLIIEDLLVVELKTVERLAPVHDAQLMTYMKLLDKPKGLLLNFYCDNIFRTGQKTLVNELFRNLPDI